MKELTFGIRAQGAKRFVIVKFGNTGDKETWQTFTCVFFHTHTHTCGSMERWIGGVRAGCMPPLLKDSERGGREGSEMRLDTLCCSAGELCLFSLDRSSTCDRSHTTVTHSTALSTTNHHAWSLMHPYKPPDNLNTQLCETHNHIHDSYENCCSEWFSRSISTVVLTCLRNYAVEARIPQKR